MKKFALTTVTLVVLSGAMPFVSAIPAYAGTSQQTKADQNLLKQIDSLQNQVNKEHNDYLKNQVHKALASYRTDLANDQSARSQLKTAMNAYEQAVKEYKGHDDGTIVKTLAQVNHILATVKVAITDDEKPEQRDIHTAQVDIQNHKLQQAIADIHKADARLKNETNSFDRASKLLNQITQRILAEGSTTGSVYGTGQ